MSCFKSFLFILTLFSITFCRKKEMIHYPATSTLLQWHGRNLTDASGHKQLIGSASHLVFRFEGDACRIWLKNEAPGEYYNYFSIVLDGVRQQRIALRSGTFIPFEINPPHKAPYHEIEFYKETEAECGWIVISTIEADSLITIPERKKKKIEFIGNSITVGMSADASLIPCEAGTWWDQHDAYDAYGPRIARALDLDYAVNGVSGKGVYRNWNTDAPTLPTLYERTYLDENPQDPSWDFTRFIPDIVTINLGTNDLSPGDGVTLRLPFDSTRFINAYVSFIANVHKHYPDARLVLLNSPVISTAFNDVLTSCLKSVKLKAESSMPHLPPVSIFSFSLFQGGGCGGHPDVKDQEHMATELKPIIFKLLGDN